MFDFQSPGLGEITGMLHEATSRMGDSSGGCVSSQFCDCLILLFQLLCQGPCDANYGIATGKSGQIRANRKPIRWQMRYDEMAGATEVG